MPLEELQIELSTGPLPDDIAHFLAVADKHCDAIFESGANKKMPAFVPADYERIYRAIDAVQREGSILGNRFVEWGSGLGTATCLAALLGFEAIGIEIQAELVKRAKVLADEFDLSPEFLEMSYLPEGYDFQNTQGARELSMPSRARRHGAMYEDVEWELEEVDLFYIYPWPGEQEAALQLFDAVASDGAYLICYYGEGEVCIYTKYLED